MAKAEISWKRRTTDGERLELYAHHVGDRWKFYIRERRVGEWTRLEEPSLDDWLELLDGIRRRVNRRLLRPEEIKRVEKTIRERFPDAGEEIKTLKR
jgi:hypothetical protein